MLTFNFVICIMIFIRIRMSAQMRIKYIKLGIVTKEGDFMRENGLEKKNRGITLIALVVTIIIIMILARDKCFNVNREKWNFKQGNRGKRKNGGS